MGELISLLSVLNAIVKDLTDHTIDVRMDVYQ